MLFSMSPPVAMANFVPAQQVLRSLRHAATTDPWEHDEALVDREVRRRDLTGQRVRPTALLHVLRGRKLLDHDAFTRVIEGCGRKFDH